MNYTYESLYGRLREKIILRLFFLSLFHENTKYNRQSQSKKSLHFDSYMTLAGLCLNTAA